jgi:hypothetical protein
VALRLATKLKMIMSNNGIIKTSFYFMLIKEISKQTFDCSLFSFFSRLFCFYEFWTIFGIVHHTRRQNTHWLYDQPHTRTSQYAPAVVIALELDGIMRTLKKIYAYYD